MARGLLCQLVGDFRHISAGDFPQKDGSLPVLQSRVEKQYPAAARILNVWKPPGSVQAVMEWFHLVHHHLSKVERPSGCRGEESDVCTLSEMDISNAEDIIKALKPMNDATTLMSEESSPICLIAPLKLNSSRTLRTGLPLLPEERVKTYRRVVAEAASLKQESRTGGKPRAQHIEGRYPDRCTQQEDVG
ncbi:hypothetical protein G5714_004361 [Onychostoma macrolepis]|uniref:Uncharacterized protein n=1 Tax=Onychostoma macrolepis TaxID=369639 RepID=A0A7J6D4I1_9TELE|nr:hypothetical protein G5714_004361 [Onychostoma macrolepis]